MKFIPSARRIIGISALGLGLLAAPSVASAAPAAPAVHVVSHAVPTAKVKTYIVVAGTYKTQAAADARLTKITNAGINGLSVVKTGKTVRTTRYRVEATGLTRTAARTLYRQLRKAKFSAYYRVG